MKLILMKSDLGRFIGDLGQAEHWGFLPAIKRRPHLLFMGLGLIPMRIKENDRHDC